MVLKAKCGAWRSWKPHADRASTTHSASTRATAEPALPDRWWGPLEGAAPKALRGGAFTLEHHVDQPAGYHDDLFGRCAGRVGNKGFADHRELFDLLAAGVRRDDHRTAVLAVDLKHQLDLVLFEGFRVDLGPGSVQQFAELPRVPKLLP